MKTCRRNWKLYGLVTAIPILVVASIISADGAGWEELAAVSEAADNASAWADSTRVRAQIAHAYADSAVAYADSAVGFALGAVSLNGSAAKAAVLRVNEAQDRTLEFFKRASEAKERASEAMVRAVTAWRTALDGRNRASEYPMNAWSLRDLRAVIAFEAHGRAQEARKGAAAYFARALDAEMASFEAVGRAKRIAALLDSL